MNMDRVTQSFFLEFGGEKEVFEIARALFDINGRLSDTFDRIEEAMKCFKMGSIWKQAIINLSNDGFFELYRTVRPYSCIPRGFYFLANTRYNIGDN